MREAAGPVSWGDLKAMHAAQRTDRRGGRKETAAYFANVTKLLTEEKTDVTRKDFKD